jgi:hypothetical protein
VKGFAPVFLPEGRTLNGRASQTLLRHYSRCPRAGYLAKLTDSAPTAEMARGTALHSIQERATLEMVETGNTAAPWELVRAIAEEVLAEQHVPVEEHDAIREMAWRWAEETEIDPVNVVAVETLFALDVPVRCGVCEGKGVILPLPLPRIPDVSECPECGGSGRTLFEVRCRVDFAQLEEDGAVVRVEDVKSSKAAVPFEEMARTRSDGSLHAKDFQLILYAVALAYGVPVREEPCATCAESPGWSPACPTCSGKGRVETRDPFPVASRAQQFDVSFVYPAITGQDGLMIRRPATLTRSEVETYRQSLEGLVQRLARSEETGDWPALVSDAACGECPASALCPIPKELRDHRGTINTVEECAEALEVRFREKKEQTARTKEIRAFVKAKGPVRFGGGMVAEIGYGESERISDKDGMWAAIESGEPFDRAAWVKRVESFPLVERALTADEQLAITMASEGSYGDTGDSDGAAVDGGGPVVRGDFDPVPGGGTGDDAPF